MKTIVNDYSLLTELNDDIKQYLNVHSSRYEYLLSVVKNVRKEFPDNIEIMDIGPSVFTMMLEKNFKDDDIYSLGLEHEQSRGGHLPDNVQLDSEKFFNFNLNDSQDKEKWIQLPYCDIVIMAEVLEHLYTAPTLVLTFIASFIKPGGYLVIQTPNAASLKNRLFLLAGKNPYEMIRENADNPGHFREYTAKELTEIAEKTSFTVCLLSCKSYFNPRNKLEKMYIFITKFLPQSFKDGITIVLKKNV
jgi:predicted SAM-dependent methyltransferase